MLTLIGSQTSPYVRRIRLLLVEHPYHFQQVNIFDPGDRSRINIINPLKLIPILKDNDQVILDSREIFYYLAKEKKLHPQLSWDQGNILTIIDGVNDSLISLLLLKRSGNEFSSPHIFFDAQIARIKDGLIFLEKEIETDHFRDWNYLSMSLFSLIDWIEFRELWKIQDIPKLLQWKKSQLKYSGITETDPRLA